MQISNLICRPFKKLSFLIVSLFILHCGFVNAVLIDFDELNPADYSEENGNPYLTNEYQSQGLVFKHAAYLLEWSGDRPVVSAPNYVGGPGFSFEFIGNLPSYVSFYLGSSTQMAVSIDVSGPNYFSSLASSGENHDLSGDLSTPYIPNELFTFYSATGISLVEFSGRGDVFIDDLVYTYSSPAQVPEPSAYILLVIGLAGLVGSRFGFLFGLPSINRRLS